MQHQRRQGSIHATTKKTQTQKCCTQEALARKTQHSRAKSNTRVQSAAFAPKIQYSQAKNAAQNSAHTRKIQRLRAKCSNPTRKMQHACVKRNTHALKNSAHAKNAAFTRNMQRS